MWGGQYHGDRKHGVCSHIHYYTKLYCMIYVVNRYVRYAILILTSLEAATPTAPGVPVEPAVPDPVVSGTAGVATSSNGYPAEKAEVQRGMFRQVFGMLIILANEAIFTMSWTYCDTPPRNIREDSCDHNRSSQTCTVWLLVLSCVATLRKVNMLKVLAGTLKNLMPG